MEYKSLVSETKLTFPDYFLLLFRDAFTAKYMKNEKDPSFFRRLNLLFLFFVFGLNLYSQTYDIKTNNLQTINTCSGTFWDSGVGTAVQYGNNEDYTVTFCAPVGSTYKFDFTNFFVRTGDALYVYDGPNTSSPLIGIYFGLSSPWGLPDFSILSTGTCLTFNFKSDGSFTRPGWKATINCNSCPSLVTSPILPSNTEECAGTKINYSVDLHPGSTYNWTITDGTPSNASGVDLNNLDVTWNLPGNVTGSIRVDETSACGSTSFSELFVDIYPLPAPSISGLADVCPNASGVTYSTPSVVGNTYNWIVSGGTFSGSGNSITVNWGATGPGTVQVTETVIATGCLATTPVYTVLIQDVTPPVISGCPANINLSTDPGSCSTTASWSEPTAIDNCTGAMTYTARSHAPGSTFNSGTTTVSYTFTDGEGNTSTCSFNVIVNDTELPVASCKNITVTLDAFNQATITGAQVDNGSSDNCGISSLTVAPNTFNASNIGPNNVTLTVIDNNGNTSNCSAVVTIIANTPPVALCKNITVYLNSAGTISISGAEIDNGSNDPDGIASLVAAPNTFSCANIGPNNVILTVTDNAGKSSTCSSVVTVGDNILPLIPNPGNLNYNVDPGVCGKVVNYVTPVGTDNCTGSVTSQTSGFASGSFFPVGTTTNTFVVTDGSGNTASCSFTVTVTDNEKPVITLPIPPVINADASCQALIPVIAATFSDNCTPSASLIISQVPAAGTTVGTGITIVTITAIDLAGNSSSSVINVTVVDVTKPVITVPPDVTQNLDINCHAVVPDFLATLVVTDDCTAPGAIIKTQIPAAGTVITGAASTNIQINATDASGNTSSVTVLFITMDVTPPVVLCKNINLYLDGTGNATLTPSAIDNGSTDNCSPALSLSVSKSAFSCSDIGTPVSVTLTGTDGSLNSASCTSLVTVIDTIKPTVNVQTYNLVLNPVTGTGTLVPANVDNGTFDNCGLSSLSVAPNTFNCGDQGIKTIVFTATDTHGNSRSRSVSITVSSTLNAAITLSSCNGVGPFAIYTSTITGGNGTYTYFWDVLEGGVNPFVNFDFIPPFIHFTNTSTVAAPLFNNLMPDGIYNIRLRVTDGNGCQASATFVLNKGGFVFNNVTRINSSACVGETKTYSVAFDAGATYSWNITNGTFLSPVNTNTVTVLWNLSVPSGLLVANIAKNDLAGNPCGSAVENTVTINQPPVPVFSIAPVSVCSGTEYTYTLSNTYSSHSWTVAGGAITGGGAVVDNYVKVLWGAGPAGTVSVLVTNASGCSNTVTQAVTVNPLPAPTLISNDVDNTFCAGTSVTFTAGGGNNYNFRVNGTTVQNSGATTYTTPSLTNGQVVDVIVTNGSGCSATSAGITNTVITYPSPTLVSSDIDNIFCSGTSVVFTASGGTNFNFRVNGVTVQNSGAPTYTTSSLTNGQIVDVIVSNAGGCSTTSAGIANTVYALPVASISSSDADNKFCAGTSVTFTASGGTIYNFRINGISIQSGASTSFTTTALLNLQVVDVIVTNAGGCSATSAGVTNIVDALPAATLSSSASGSGNVICAGASVTFTAGGGTNYDFRVNGSSIQNGASSTFTTTTLTNGEVVDVIVSNAGGCSSTSAGITTTVTTPPTITISYSGSPYCSTTGAGQTVTLTGPSGGTYTALPATGLSLDPSTGAINPSTSTPGAYIVTYTIPAAGGCGPVTATAPVTITPVPVATFSYTGTPYCINAVNPSPTFSGGGIAGTFSSSAGLVFISTATGQVNLLGSTPGSYIVTNIISAWGGCGIVTSSSPITITAVPTSVINYAGNPFCTSVATAQPVTLTGTGAYTGGTYSSTPGLVINSSTGDITPGTSAAGTYIVTYTVPASGGCPSVQTTTTVTITTASSATINYAGSPFCTTLGAGQPVTQTGTPGGSYTSIPAGLILDPVSGAVNPSASSVGAYIVTYTIPGGGGCPPVSATAPVTITSAPTALITYVGSPFCSSVVGTRSVSLTGTGAYTGGTYSSTLGLSISPVTGAITPSTSAAGTYIVTYTTLASGGCAPVSATTSVTITMLPVATISYAGAPFCTTVTTAQPVTLTGTSGGTFTAVPAGLSIDPSTGAITPSTSAPATYTVNYAIAASGGCGVVTATTNVTITALPTVNIFYAGSPFCISLGIPQTVTINGTGDYLGGTFSSTAGLTIDPANGLVNPSSSSPGSYIVTYVTVASGGCAAVTATTSVTVAALPAPSFITSPGANTCAGASVTYTTQTGGGITNYVWTVPGTPGTDYSIISGGIDASSNSVTLKWLTTGSKIVSVNYSNAAGCSATVATNSTPTLVSLSLPVSVSVIADANPVCAGTTVNFTATPTNGGSTPVYQWKVNGVNAGINSSTYSYVPVNNDVVSVVLTSSAVCTTGSPATSNSVTMTVSPLLPVSVSITASANPVCSGAAVTFTASPTNGGTNPSFQWKVNGISVGANLITYNYSPATGDLVNCVLTSNATCISGSQATSNTIIASVDPISVGGNVSGGTMICSGNTSAALSLSGQTGAVTKWQSSVDGGTTWSDIANTLTTYTSGALTQTTQFRAVVASGVCSAANSSATTVTIAPSVGTPVFTLGTTSTICQGSVPITYVASATNTTGITYTLDAASIAGGNSIVAGTGVVTYDATWTGTTVITASAAGCNGPATAIHTVTINPAPVVPTAIVSIQPTCGVPTGTIVVTAPLGAAYEYNIDGGTFQSGVTFGSLSPGNHTLTTRLVASPSCVSASSGALVVNAVPSPPAPPTVANTTQPTCGTPTGTVVFTAQAGVEYSIGAGYQTGTTFAGLLPGTYTLTVRSISDNTCITAAVSTVTINTIPSPPAVPTVANTTQPTCGTPTGTIVFTVQNGVEYSIGAGYQAGTTFAGLTPGTYTLTVRSTTDNTCITAAASTVTINAIPLPPSVPTISSTTQPTCGTPTGTIVFTAQAGVDYSVGGAYQVSPVFAGLPPGIYVLTVRSTSDNTCITPAGSTVSINTIPSAPTVTTSKVDILCFGGTTGSATAVAAGGTGPYTYSWNSVPVQTTPTAVALGAGTYIVTVTDANSCTTTSSVTLTQPAATLAGTPVVTNISCFGGSNGAIFLTISGGTSPYTYLWNNGATTKDITNLTVNNYSVLITDANGCTATTGGNVSQPAAILSGSTAVTNVLCNGQSTGAVTLTVTGGTFPYSYLWNNGATTKNLSNIVAGNYSVTITDTNGCTAFSGGNVTQPATALSGSTSVTNVLCFGSSTGVVDLTVSGGILPYTYLWSNGATTEDLSNVPAGSYTVKVTDANGCFINPPAVITEPAKLSIEPVVTNASCPGVRDGSITLKITGGIQPYRVIWNDGNTSASRSATDSTYTVIVTDANMCITSQVIEVTFDQGSNCLLIPAVITPNDDGKNDTWIMKNIDLYPNAEVLIFNRWGKLIYRTKNISANPWDGRFDGKLVPMDSYHYILYLNDGSEPRNGVITVVR
jgi:gliding motility-associated-like protein